MAVYHQKIKKVKEEGLEIVKSKFQGKSIRLLPADSSHDTAKLCLKWRMRYWDGFDTKFRGTVEQTKRWINSITVNPDRALFMITYDGKKIGHIGLDRYDKSDNAIYITDVLRGVRGFSPGLMEFVQKLFIAWIFRYLKISIIRIRVFSDNYKAINLYEKCGFLMIDSIPVKRRFTNDGWKWVKIKIRREGTYAERYFSVMEISK